MSVPPCVSLSNDSVTLRKTHCQSARELVEDFEAQGLRLDELQRLVLGFRCGDAVVGVAGKVAQARSERSGEDGAADGLCPREGRQRGTENRAKRALTMPVVAPSERTSLDGQ